MLTFVAVSRIRIQWKKLYLFFALFDKQNNFYYLFFPVLLLAFFPLLVRFMFSAFLLLIWTFFLQKESVRLNNNKKNFSYLHNKLNFVKSTVTECYKFQMRTFGVSDWKLYALNRCQFFWFYLLCMLPCILLDFWHLTVWQRFRFQLLWAHTCGMDRKNETKRMLSVHTQKEKETKKI